jgi:hypothetical protein
VTNLRRGSTRYSPTRWDADDPSLGTEGHQRGHDWKEVMIGGKVIRQYKPKCKCRWKGSIWYGQLKHMKDAFYHLHWVEVKAQQKLPYEGSIQLKGGAK